MKSPTDFPWLRQAIAAIGLKESFTHEELSNILAFAELFDRRVKRPERQTAAISKFIFEEAFNKEAYRHAENIVARLKDSEDTFDEAAEVASMVRASINQLTEEEERHLTAFYTSYVKRVVTRDRQARVVDSYLYDCGLIYDFPRGMEVPPAEIIVQIYNAN